MSLLHQDAAAAVIGQHLLQQFITYRINAAAAKLTERESVFDRWNIGLQQRVMEALDLRVGSNNSGMTAGFTWRMGEKMTVDYAYVSEALNDKEEIFGETEQHTVAVSCVF